MCERESARQFERENGWVGTLNAVYAKPQDLAVRVSGIMIILWCDVLTVRVGERHDYKEWALNALFPCSYFPLAVIHHQDVLQTRSTP